MYGRSYFFTPMPLSSTERISAVSECIMEIVSMGLSLLYLMALLTISMIHSETADVLSVEDNGIGVKKYDLPYIFQKGFTGDSTDSRKKATGIGLYLVKKMADDLNLRLEAASPWEKGFKIVIFFPKLKSNGGK